MEQELKKGKERIWNGRVKKTISFMEEHKEVLEYLDDKGNASRYIIDLIKADMQGHKKTALGERELSEILSNMDSRLQRIEGILRTGGMAIEPNSLPAKCELGDKILKSIKVFMDEDE
ncbi:hypothetical protein [Turicibacter sp. TS3]|uniref:hypothetical protein n=1 Tax=Turicibacter sp. TS3 TaxID=2304578 RepID=UPI00137AF5D3|nr:hypothetical protein [Turicibacter sp. TS3]NCE78316.1 hypothetical protein [Turicibacter sp. TS3]